MPHHSTTKPHPSANSAGALGVYRRFSPPLRAFTMHQPINASRPITNNQLARRASSPGSIKTTHPVLTIHSLSRLAAERIREILLGTTRDKNVLLGKSSRLTSTSSRVSSRPPLPIKPSFVLPSIIDPLRNLRTRHSLPCPLRSGRSNTHRPLEEPSSLRAKKHLNQHRHFASLSSSLERLEWHTLPRSDPLSAVIPFHDPLPSTI